MLDERDQMRERAADGASEQAERDAIGLLRAAPVRVGAGALRPVGEGHASASLPLRPWR
jgi:hypothetical protein